MIKPLTFGSLFSGIGGIDLGLERAGIICKWQSEIDSYSSRVLKKHWPNVPNHGDITKMQTDQIEKVDLICGGWPCQDLSVAGKGAGLKGEWSGLFYELTRIVRGIRPHYLLLENVAALLVRGLDDVLGTLAALGYDAEWYCLPAATFGAPHRRDRIYIIGKKNISSGSAVADAYCDGCKKNAEQKPKPGSASRFEVFTPPQRQKNLFCQLQQFRNDCKWWATEPGVGRVANGISNRVDRIRGLGNAVVPQIAEWIGLTFFRGNNENIN